MIVHDLDERDSKSWPKLKRAHHAVAGRDTCCLQFALRDTMGPLELLTLSQDWEQENQGVAEWAKKALTFTTGSVLIDCWSLSSNLRRA